MLYLKSQFDLPISIRHTKNLLAKQRAYIDIKLDELDIAKEFERGELSEIITTLEVLGDTVEVKAQKVEPTLQRLDNELEIFIKENLAHIKFLIDNGKLSKKSEQVNDLIFLFLDMHQSPIKDLLETSSAMRNERLQHLVESTSMLDFANTLRLDFTYKNLINVDLKDEIIKIYKQTKDFDDYDYETGNEVYFEIDYIFKEDILPRFVENDSFVIVMANIPKTSKNAVTKTANLRKKLYKELEETLQD